GKPKGVMLSHRNFCSNVEAVSHVLSCGPDDSCLSFLPLSHSFERLAGFYHMLSRGVTINYAETMETVARDLIEVAPTLLIGVPRVYEKIYARVLENATEGTAIKRRIFFWSKRNAELWADATLDKKPISAALAVKRAIADKLVFTKLRARTGGRVRFMVSGAAPLSPDIAKFFYAAGLPIIEGYGLTETSPVISVNPLDGIKLGFVGPPIPGVEVRIADDGEICARGPNIMLGYHANPQATAEVIDAEGWFHTGDIGEIDADGYIRITDRKKDIIVTAGGKNIAPQPIENMVKLNGYILNVVMLGDKRRFPIMLVVPDDAALGKWAAERGLTGLTKSELLAHPDALAKIEREVMRELRGLASYETPKKVVLLEEDFSVENGELTPTLKIKRRVVEERYSDLIERTYQD
ncbi:MAG: AMP-dependent synthetase/ligase, partial [Gemmatimonadales bacterium]